MTRTNAERQKAYRDRLAARQADLARSAAEIGRLTARIAELEAELAEVPAAPQCPRHRIPLACPDCYRETSWD